MEASCAMFENTQLAVCVKGRYSDTGDTERPSCSQAHQMLLAKRLGRSDFSFFLSFPSPPLATPTSLLHEIAAGDECWEGNR